MCGKMSKSEKLNKFKNNLLLPHPYNDDFLQTMTRIVHLLRWVGIPGIGGMIWKIWGFIVLSLLLIIEGQSIWKVVKALAGWAIDLQGHSMLIVFNRPFLKCSIILGSVTARLGGTMFYSAALLCLIQCWWLSHSWSELSKYWASIEWTLNVQYVPRDRNLKKRMYTVVIGVSALAVVEHLVAMSSTIDFSCEISTCFQKYVLKSHGFMILEHEYSVWIGLPVFFMSLIATVHWNLRDLIIMLTSMGLSSRYQRLNQCVKTVITKNNKIDKLNKVNNDAEFLRMYLWRKIREAYVKQAMLVRKVDSSLGSLILLSAFFNFYFICLQLFLRITPGGTAFSLNQIYHTVSLVWVCLRTCYTVIAAADVNKCSKLALPYLYECHTQYYNIEIERLQKQLTRDYVALTGMGFFYLNRTFVLQMAGAVVTYVLVLIQYDDSDPILPTNSTNITLFT